MSIHNILLKKLSLPSKGILSLFLISTPLSQAHAIAGGEPLTPEISPYVVNIHMPNGMCTGTMISPNVVLTAAHCADMSGKPDVVAYITGSPTKPCDISNVIDVAYEPSALPILPLHVHSPDILLLKLDKPLCSTKIATVSQVLPQAKDQFFVAGHGEGNKKFGQAEKMQLEMIETNMARSQVLPMTEWADDILTIGSKTYLFALPVKKSSSVCAGDSGGSVFREEGDKMQVFGVNGATLPNETLGASCNSGYLQILTPTAPYYEWIQNKIKEWKLP